MKKTKQPSASSRSKRIAPAVKRRRHRLSQDEVDERLIAEAGDDSAWEAPVRVSRKRAAIGLPASLAIRPDQRITDNE
jgi:hypothetical protein